MRKTRQSNSKLMDSSDSLEFSEISIKVKNKTRKQLKCRICETVLSKHTLIAMKNHRNTCKMTDTKEECQNENEKENENTQIGMESLDISQININSCIVCNDVEKLDEQNIGELMSQHSETRMCDLIHRCLGTYKIHRDIDDESYCLRVCHDCVLKLNEYDLACVTAERVGYELQQMLLQTDQLFVENDTFKPNKIQSRRNTVSNNSNGCVDNSAEDETNDYCMSLDKVEVFEVPALQTHDEQNDEHNDDDNDIDDALSDLENDSTESIGNEVQNLVDDTKAKRIYECDTCPEKFNLWKELRKHRAEHRNESTKFRCDICNFDPKNEDALVEHKKMHIGLSPLQCVVCKKTFSHKRNIRPHMRLHTGQKKYQCDRCGKEYYHKSSFSLHMAYHDGIRTENCPHCPRQFMAKNDLEKHIRIHTGEKPYPCGVCGKRFALRANMREHQKIHDKQETEKAYSCSHCDASFARPSKFHKHMEKHGVISFARDIRIGNEFVKSDNNRKANEQVEKTLDKIK